MKPRIVILSAFLTPLRSGAEACAEEVPLALRDQYDFVIVTARMRKDLPKHDKLFGSIPVVRVGLGCTLDKWLYPFLAPLAAAKQKPVIIHAILETFAGLALRHCRFVCPQPKRILTLQTTNRSFLKKRIVKGADRVTAISRALISVAGPFRRDKITHIPNGVHLDIIPDKTKVSGRIVFVGRIEKMKGIDTLLQAFSSLPPGPPPPEGGASLHIVGDGSQRAELEKMAQGLGIADRVTFVGFLPVPTVYNEFAEAEIFCGLSRSEALGNVFFEAQAAGCAVVGTTIGGIPDIIDDGKTGLLVEPDNVQQATEALSKLLSNKALRENLAANGRKSAQKYDWSKVAQSYSEVYRSVIIAKICQDMLS